MYKILLAIIAGTAITVDGKHPLCTNQNLQVVGSSLLEETLFLFVLDERQKQTSVYRIPASNIKPLHGKILVNDDIQRESVAAIWNYDPYSHNRIPQNIFVISGPRSDETIITFIYDETHTHAESVSSYTKQRTESLYLNKTRNAIIWNDQCSGLHFFKVNPSDMWIVRDISYFGNEFWPKEEIFVVAKTDEEILYKSSLPNENENSVNWTRLSGFIYDTVNVFLFTDQGVFYYIDPFEQHQGSLFAYKYKRNAYNQVFWCDGELPKIYFRPLLQVKNGGNNRVFTIYVLFVLHFVAALVMLVFIVKVNLFESSDNISKLEQNSKKGFKSKSKKSSNSQIAISGRAQVQSKNF